MSLPAETNAHNDTRSPTLEHIKVNVIVEMTYYEHPQPSSRGKRKAQPKKLPAKIKDFEGSIGPGKEGWLSFLKQILVCHDESKFCVSARKPYGIKVLIPPEKAK